MQSQQANKLFFFKNDLYHPISEIKADANGRVAIVIWSEADENSVKEFSCRWLPSTYLVHACK